MSSENQVMPLAYKVTFGILIILTILSGIGALVSGMMQKGMW